LLRRGLAVDLAEVESLISSKKVQVNGSFASTPAQMVLKSDSLELTPNSNRYVSRGGDKLEHALQVFDINPENLNCVDIGASTGGFSDCLLQQGASTVTTIDVGYGLLHERLANDPRIIKFERLNIRDASSKIPHQQFGLLVADLSFISLKLVLQDLMNLCTIRASMVLLMKPQFESSYEEASRAKGVIRDPRIWKRTLKEVQEEANTLGAPLQKITASPLSGARGNREFFVHLKIGGEQQPINIDLVIEEMKLDSE